MCLRKTWAGKSPTSFPGPICSSHEKLSRGRERTLGTRLVNHMIFVTSSFSNGSFSNCFPPTVKRKVSVFKFFQFEERFRKAPFSRRISVDGRSNRGNKAAFSNLSDVGGRGSLWNLNKPKGFYLSRMNNNNTIGIL